MDVYSHLLTERIVYLGTAIDAGVANALIAQLLHLEAASRDQEIQLYINCEGGDPSAMLAVYDTMRYVRSPVATTCVGQAVAVGAVLLAAGRRGEACSAAAHARRAAPARGAGPRHDPRPDPAGRRGRPRPFGHRGGAVAAHRPDRSSASGATPITTGSSPPRARATTA